MPTDGWLTTRGLRLHVCEWGRAGHPAVLFLHGGAAHARWWDFVLPPLADRYRCVALDLRGHGDSDWAPDGDYSLAAHADDVCAVRAALDLEPCAVVGHSFGGHVALEHARTPGVSLTGLAVIDSRPTLDGRGLRYLDAIRRLPPPRYASQSEAEARFRLLPAATTTSAAILRHVARHSVRQAADGRWIHKADRRALPGAAATVDPPTLRDARCPVLVVRGAHSAVVPREALDAWRHHARDVACVELAEAHHHVLLDQPIALARALGTFLDRVTLVR
jgi:pimeloyl-ACP methyl ester carboxylesterase